MSEPSPLIWAKRFRSMEGGPRAIIDDLLSNSWANGWVREDISEFLKLARYNPEEAVEFVNRKEVKTV